MNEPTKEMSLDDLAALKAHLRLVIVELKGNQSSWLGVFLQPH